MRQLRSRRALFTAALVTSALLVACGGGGSIKSSFVPTRGVLLDGAGQSWAQNVLNGYGPVSAVVASGGANYSLGSAPVLASNGTPTLSQRVDTAIALGLGAGDLVIVSAGVPDIANTAVDPAAAGRAMADQVRRLVNAGARHVLVGNNFDVGLSPYATGLSQRALFSARTRTFNDTLKVSMADLGDSVLLADLELYFNQVVGSGGSGTGLTNGTAAACVGSTVGTGAVSSSSCASGTGFGSNDPATFLFYDPLYLSARSQELAGSVAYGSLRGRW